MSIYGALFSGVSGLSAQSQSLSAISDNIANVNTVGYKSTHAQFSTMVTKQATGNDYSPGGVTASPLTRVDVQGLLQSSTSSTDIAVSGQGFFVVNASVTDMSANPQQAGTAYEFTRAGSFVQDQNGYLRNTSGLYLQGWKLDSQGNITNPVTGNITPVNQNAITNNDMTTVRLSNLGGTAQATSTLSIGANLPATDTINVAGVGNQPTALSTESTNVLVYDSLGVSHNVPFNWTKLGVNAWGLETTPPSGASSIQTVDINNNVFGAQGQLNLTTQPSPADTLKLNGTTYTFVAGAPVGNQIQIGLTIPNTLTNIISATGNDPRFTSNGTDTITITQRSSQGISFDATGCSAISQNSSGAVTIQGLGQQDGTAINTALLAGAPQYATQAVYHFSPAAVPAAGQTITVNGTLYTVGGNWAGPAASVAAAITNLVAAIGVTTPGETRYSMVGAGANASLVFTQSANGNAQTITPGTAVMVPAGAIATTVAGSNSVPVVTTASARSALTFNGNGTPASIIPNRVDVTWDDGATTMGGGIKTAANPGGTSIAIDLGTVGQATGITQFAGVYSTSFINQNGTKFGQFTGVAINNQGIVTAMFDNGVTRNIYKVPLATFPNPDKLESKTGNAFTVSQNSGNYLLNHATTGGSGSIASSSLEASVVDLAEEFTNMIVTQRAYSASTKIITTADDMLNELISIKR